MIDLALKIWDFVFSRLATTVPYLLLRSKLRRTRVEATQNKTLDAIIHGMRDSRYLHRYLNNKSKTDLISQFPVVTYAEIEPEIKEVFAGDHKALFADDNKPIYFALTSGTTGRRKTIPITPASIKALKKTFWDLGVNLFFQNPGNQIHAILNLASAPWIEDSPTGIPCGEVTGLIARHQTKAAKMHYAIPEVFSQISDMEARYYAYLKVALCYPQIHMIMTATPATITSLADILAKHSKSLVQDIANGTFHFADRIEPEIYRSQKAYLEYQSTSRAKSLLKILEQDGQLIPRRVWTQMQTIITWLSGSFGHYQNKIREVYKPQHLRDAGLSASEGYFSVPLANNDTRCLLNVWHYYFEFRKDGRIFKAHEIKKDETYDLIVSTPGGLLRYDMRDRIICRGHHHEIPLIEFQSKSSDYLDLTAEKLSAFLVSQIAAEAGKKFKINSARFFCSANSNRDGFEIWIVEPDLNDKDYADFFDQRLGQENECYQEHRQIGKLSPLKAHSISIEKYQDIVTSIRQKRGSSREQFKTPVFIDRNLVLD